MDFALEEKRIEGLLENGWQRFVSDDYETALREVETVLLIDGENAVANSLAAACLFRLGRVAEAEPLARNGVRLAPQAALARVFLAEVLLAAERYDEAESELWEAVALEPYSADMHLELARFLLARSRYAEAGERAESATYIAPENAEAHLLTGYCSMRAQEFDKADAALERAFALNPEDDRAPAYRGMLCLAQAYILIKSPQGKADYMQAARKLGLASEFLRRALEINPENREAKENLASADKALKHAKKLIRAKPLSNWGLIAGALLNVCIAFILTRPLFKDGAEPFSAIIILLLIAAALAVPGLAIYFARKAKRRIKE